MQDVWPKLTGLKWLHSNLAGIESLMIPELLTSSVTVTNCKVKPAGQAHSVHDETLGLNYTKQNPSQHPNLLAHTSTCRVHTINH